ncbi:MAG: sigma factor [Solirubrobacteraceae bacterium]
MTASDETPSGSGIGSIEAARRSAPLAARRGDTAAFERLISGHRRELYVHCYRMLGGIPDAEDAHKEALLAAWRRIGAFEERSSLPAWLYRIATNVCLRVISRRPRRILSPDHGPPRQDTIELGELAAGPVWLEPCSEAEPATRPRTQPQGRLAPTSGRAHWCRTGLRIGPARASSAR